MNLARIRKQRQLTQAQLGELIGVDQATIQRAEAMADSAMMKTYRACAQVFGVTLVDLFADDRTATEQSLIAAFRRIAPDQHGRVLDLLLLAEAQPRA